MRILFVADVKKISHVMMIKTDTTSIDVQQTQTGLQNVNIVLERMIFQMFLEQKQV